MAGLEKDRLEAAWERTSPEPVLSRLLLLGVGVFDIVVSCRCGAPCSLNPVLFEDHADVEVVELCLDQPQVAHQLV